MGWLLLGLAVVAGLLYFLVAVNFSQNIVSSETYNIAVSDTGAYNRIYEEVLADPEVKENIGNLLGGVEFDEVDEGRAERFSVRSCRRLTSRRRPRTM